MVTDHVYGLTYGITELFCCPRRLVDARQEGLTHCDQPGNVRGGCVAGRNDHTRLAQSRFLVGALLQCLGAAADVGNGYWPILSLLQSGCQGAGGIGEGILAKYDVKQDHGCLWIT